MSTGFHIEGSSGTNMSWNLSMGNDTGFSLVNNADSILTGNIAIGSEVFSIFGQEFEDVAVRVQKSKDFEALAALAEVVRTPESAVAAWSILVTKFGTSIGAFKIAMLEGILSSAAWDLLKTILSTHGISL